ncbi:MAG: hypothetical protein MZU84_06970 [Sphingobacterium sp.]|nr:hypothetical protein [Sphingobacterium sp.]
MWRWRWVKPSIRRWATAKGIVRMGDSFAPMDETLAHVAIDLSGRPYAVVQVEWHTPYVGNIPVDVVPAFL